MTGDRSWEDDGTSCSCLYPGLPSTALEPPGIICGVFVAACGLSLVVVRGLLTVVASLVVEQGF